MLPFRQQKLNQQVDEFKKETEQFGDKVSAVATEWLKNLVEIAEKQQKAAPK